MFKEIINDFARYYNQLKDWLFIKKHNYIFNRVVENCIHKESYKKQPVFAILNKNRDFEYLTKTQYNYRVKYGSINPETKRRLVKFYDTSEPELIEEFRKKFIDYALYLRDKKN